jgi:hypothetical protein
MKLLLAVPDHPKAMTLHLSSKSYLGLLTAFKKKKRHALKNSYR